MANENQIMIVGNLTRDPELRYTPNGAALVKFGVAVSRRLQDESGQWGTRRRRSSTSPRGGQLAENMAESLTPGDPGRRGGRLRTNTWETPRERSAARSRSRPTRSAAA